MLDEFSVRNLGLIPTAHLEPGPGFVVITGETGTGKTLLLGALRLLRGEQARKDQIGPHGDETVVEGRFAEGESERVVSRRVDRNRSRASIDGAMATAATLASTLEGELDVVGQHDRTLLSRPAAARSLIDGSLDEAGRTALASYRKAWDALADVQAQSDALGGDRRALERELDVVRFQSEEILDAGFAAGDEAELSARAVRLRNAQELRERLDAALRSAGDGGAASALDTAGRELIAAARTDETLEPLVEMGGHVSEMLSELNAEVARALGDLDHDPGELDDVEGRLALLGDLKRKYGASLDAVLAFGGEAETRVRELDLLLGKADEIEEELGLARANVAGAAHDLSASRRDTADSIADLATAHLTDLGFSDPVIRFAIAAAEPGPDGADRVVLEFASDRSLEPGPVARVASGGELSRLILALRLASGADDVGIVAFDEIDAGVGGSTALSMGRKLKALSNGRQVFCVTHLPQVAAFANRHFVVRREANAATIESVDGDARLEELSRMLAGLADSERGRDHAAELLSLASET
ncbi:MAG: DNA repair protein RecN [Actinomycetota bacterium]